MPKQHFLFLTNVNDIYSALLDYSNRYPNEVDFLVHSTNKESEHFADLRNTKIISNHLLDNSIIIFYLTGNLSIYIINEYFTKFTKNEHKVVYLFSSLNLYYSPNTAQYKTSRKVIEIVKSKSVNYMLLSLFLTENIYASHFKKWDEKYFAGNPLMKSLIIPNDKLIEKIITVSTEDKRNEKIHIINSKLNSLENIVSRIRPNRIEKLLRHKLLKKGKYISDAELNDALKLFTKLLPTFNQANVITLVNLRPQHDI